MHTIYLNSVMDLISKFETDWLEDVGEDRFLMKLFFFGLRLPFETY